MLKLLQLRKRLVKVFCRIWQLFIYLPPNRLLRVDDDAVIVKWGDITEEELNASKDGEARKVKPDMKTSVSGGLTNNP